MSRSRRLAMLCMGLGAIGAVFPGQAHAVDLIGVNDMVRNSSTTVNATRVFINVSNTNDPSNNTWLLRLMVKDGSNRFQVGLGNSAGNQYSSCPGNFQVITAASFLESTHQGFQFCVLVNLNVTGANIRLNRHSTSSDQWDGYYAGNFIDGLAAMNQPDDIYAGGYYYSETNAGLYSTYGLTGFSWDRTANTNNTGWTAIQTSQQIEESHWLVDNPPSPFIVSYN